MSEHEWTAPGSERPEPTRPWAPQPAPGTGPTFPGSAPGPAQGPGPGHPGYPSPGGPAYPPQGGPAYPPQPGYPPPGGPGGWAGYLAAVELRPGIIPLRPLGLGDIYTAVTKTIRGNVGATIGLAFITILVLTVPSTALGLWIGNQADTALNSTDSAAGGGMLAAVGLGALGSYIPALVIAFGAIVLTGFVSYVVGQAVLGRKVRAGETWDGTKGRLGSVVVAAVLTGLIEVAVVVAIVIIPVVLLVTSDSGSSPTGGLIALVLVTVLLALIAVAFLWTRFAFPTAAIVLERIGPIAGIGRSWRLTSGTPFWRVLGIRVLTAVIVGIVSELLTLPISLIALVGYAGTSNESHLYVMQAAVSGLTGLITGAITTPFSAGVDAVLYVDQRIRREGLDVRLIAASQAAGPQPWSTAGPG